MAQTRGTWPSLSDGTKKRIAPLMKPKGRKPKKTPTPKKKGY